MRAISQAAIDPAPLAATGISLPDLADPDMRIEHRAAMTLLRVAVERKQAPTLGLRAGELFEPGDYDVLEYAARSCSTLRQAILCTNRYMGLMHGAQECTLHEQGERARWELHITDDVEQLPAANDFALTSAVMCGRRYTGSDEGLLEVHFRHDEPTDMAEYRRIFGPAEIYLGAPHNALVLESLQLDRPMTLANASLHEAYEARASKLLQQIGRAEGVSGRVRAALLTRLGSGDASAGAVARQLGMAATTLRRKLAEEGTTFSDLLDALRRELSQRYLRDERLAISEVAFLLGFAHAPAFNKAFGRWWGGTTPTEFRASLK